ncbi:MAG: hypothetical protein V4594_02485 [Bacteroidota bacterium]
MGKLDGKHLTGLIGGVVIRRGKNGPILSSRPATKRRTKAEKQSATIFGKASRLSKRIRDDLAAIYGDFKDGGMVNRLVTLNRQVLEHCFDSDTQTFEFEQDSFSRITGFEFNNKSALINYLWVSPTVVLNDGQLTINLPEINISEQLVFVGNTNACRINIAIAMLLLSAGYQRDTIHIELEIDASQLTFPAQDWSFAMPEGCLCVVGAGLQFYTIQGQYRNSYGNPPFAPAAICGAVYRPGTYDEPVDYRDWQAMGLSLPTESPA